METNFPLETLNRQVKLEKLARELPMLPRSFLDKISDKLIQIISAKEVQDLYEGRMVPEALAQPSINHTLDLEKVSRMVETAAAELKLESPITYVKPLFSQGEGSLSGKDLEILRGHRKDARGVESLESSLSYFNSFLGGLNTPISESDALKALYIVLPVDCLLTMEQLTFRKASLKEVFANLQTIHGSRKSLDELQVQIENTMKNIDNSPPIDVLSKMNQILLKSASSQSDMDQTAIRETRRYLKSLGGEGLWNSVLAHFNNAPGRHFRDLLRILNEFYSETLKELHDKKKIRNIVVTNPSPNGTEVASGISNLDSVQIAIKRIFGVPDKTDISQGLCFNCGNPGHISRDCKQKKQTNIQSNQTRPRAPPPIDPSLPYNDQSCSVHAPAFHTNGRCKTQLAMACTIHGNHSQASCTMAGRGGANNPPGGYSGSKQGHRPNPFNPPPTVPPPNWPRQPGPGPSIPQPLGQPPQSQNPNLRGQNNQNVNLIRDLFNQVLDQFNP